MNTPREKVRKGRDAHMALNTGEDTWCICRRERAKPGQLGERCQAAWNARFPPRKAKVQS